MLYLPDEKTLRETVAPGLICSQGNPFDEPHLRRIAGMVGKRIPEGPIEKVSIMFVMRDEALRLMPLLERYPVEVRSIVGEDETTLRAAPPSTPAPVTDAAPQGTLLPVLKHGSWPRQKELIGHRLPEGGAQAAGPWVAYGFDLPDRMHYLPLPGPTDPDLAMVKKQALVNLARRTPKIEEIAKGVLQVRDEYAAETVLLASMIAELRRRLSAEVLVLGVPRQGILFAADAAGPRMPAVMGMTRDIYAKAPENVRIYEAGLATWENEVQGLLTASAPGKAPPAGPAAKPGFLSRLFGS